MTTTQKADNQVRMRHFYNHNQHGTNRKKGFRPGLIFSSPKGQACTGPQQPIHSGGRGQPTSTSWASPCSHWALSAAGRNCSPLPRPSVSAAFWTQTRCPSSFAARLGKPAHLLAWTQHSLPADCEHDPGAPCLGGRAKGLRPPQDSKGQTFPHVASGACFQAPSCAAASQCSHSPPQAPHPGRGHCRCPAAATPRV